MLFTTFEFAAFFAVVVVVHWVLPRPLRRYWLVLASYWFYTRAIPEYGWLIAGMTLGNYGLGLLSWSARNQQRIQRVVLTVAIVLNLATLAFYKYAGLLLATIWPFVRLWPGAGPTDPVLGIVLPLGISFFTFEFIHYQVEVARGHPPIRDPFEFALFAAFFPTQIAGPIKRFPDWVAARATPTRLRDVRVDEGLWLIVRGAFKKIVIADELAPLVAGGFSQPAHLGLGTTWFVIYAFAAQIFADFSGYTDIGRGCALLLGFTVPENFNRPYQASNPTEFWERWHISLSRWLRDYLYIPLGGSRVPRQRLYLNLLITMGLGGLWHGASWHFLVWGLYQGALLVGYRLWERWRQAHLASTPSGNWFAALWSKLVTFHLVCLGWLIFRAEHVRDAGIMVLHALWPVGLSLTSGYATLIPGPKALPTLVLGWAALVVVSGWVGGALAVAGTRRLPLTGLAERWVRGSLWWRPALTFALLLVVAIWPAHPAETFIYFRF